jgi:hypothetical protein
MELPKVQEPVLAEAKSPLPSLPSLPPYLVFTHDEFGVFTLRFEENQPKLGNLIQIQGAQRGYKVYADVKDIDGPKAWVCLPFFNVSVVHQMARTLSEPRGLVVVTRTNCKPFIEKSLRKLYSAYDKLLGGGDDDDTDKEEDEDEYSHKLLSALGEWHSRSN